MGKHMTYSSRLAAALICILMAGTATAKETRTKHYMAEQPKDVQAAMASLHIESDKIAVIMAKHPTLSAVELEAIHEISYQLEAAEKTLVKNSSTTQTAKALHAPIEALHEESEEHHAQGTRDAFGALKRAMAQHMHHDIAIAQ